MKVRDRLIVAVIAAIVVIGGVWVLLVSPERSQVSSLAAQVTAEQGTLTDAQTALAAARSAAAGYPGDVRALAEVTTAIPATADEPSVITTITKLAGTKVDVHEIDVSGAGSGAATPGASTLGLSFSFTATYQSLQSFLVALDQLTQTDGTNINATGRLFSVSGISFSPSPPGKTAATVTAQAYIQGATSGATTGVTTGVTGDTGATTTAAATP